MHSQYSIVLSSFKYRNSTYDNILSSSNKEKAHTLVKKSHLLLKNSAPKGVDQKAPRCPGTKMSPIAGCIIQRNPYLISLIEWIEPIGSI